MNNVYLKNEKSCVGCSACSQICPQKCIEMKENEHGFLLPNVNLEKCIECGVCLKLCPLENRMKFNNIIQGYAAISKNKDTILKSTSGGVFTEICKYIINNNGVVYGATWNNRLKVEHIRINKIQDIEKLNQSKYIQSSIDNSYKLVKKDLENNVIVLFSGTGCQIAGLKSFLNKDFNNLYTIEIVCHGVPSQGLFDKYILWLEQKFNKKIIKFSFRNKEKHRSGEHYMFRVDFEDKTCKYLYANEDPYYSSFLLCKTLRMSCYDCKFKGKKRISDFTLGDFWGIEKWSKKFPATNGVSAILINSDKGLDIYEQIKEKLNTEKVNIKYIFDGNKSLSEFADIKKHIEYNINDNFLFDKLKPKFNIINKLKNIIPSRIKYIIKRIK